MHQIVISNYIIGLVQQHVPCASISYVPNSVDTTQFYAPPRGKQARPTVGFVYSRTPFKGADICLGAIRQASRTLPDLHLVAFGPHEPAADLPLPAGADYTRMAPEEKLREIYSRCDAWLFGPRMEGFGLPILEAMACRTPVIATPAGAAPELVGESGGVLVNHEDPSDMARAIVRVCSQSDADWRKMSQAAYATATRYTWEDAIDRFETALSEAKSKT
jgi:glycosyltransferase involved in cell wall biosynthesis